MKKEKAHSLLLDKHIWIEVDTEEEKYSPVQFALSYKGRKRSNYKLPLTPEISQAMEDFLCSYGVERRRLQKKEGEKEKTKEDSPLPGAHTIFACNCIGGKRHAYVVRKSQIIEMYFDTKVVYDAILLSGEELLAIFQA